MKILIADDHDLVRDALSSLIRDDDKDAVVTCCGDLEGAFKALRADPSYDLALIDLRMPGMNGLDGAGRLIAAFPDLPVVIITGAANQADVRTALSMGVKGFLPKTTKGRALVNALRVVAAGETYVPASLLGSASDLENSGVSQALTPRESEVLAQLREGASNKEIARALDIQETTVKLHLRTLSTKLGARNRTDIVVKAFSSGLIA